MIIRIMGENQFRLDDSYAPEIDRLDTALHEAFESHNEPDFQKSLTELVHFIREHGAELSYDEVAPSDLIVPEEDMTIEEVRNAMAE